MHRNTIETVENKQGLFYQWNVESNNNVDVNVTEIIVHWKRTAKYPNYIIK